MTISLRCPCGKAFRAKSEDAGRKIKCPACAKVLVIPRPRAAGGEIDLGELTQFTPATSAPPRFSPSGLRPIPTKPAKRSRLGPIVALSVGGAVALIALLAILFIAFFPKGEASVSEAVAGKSASPSLPVAGYPVLPGAVASAPSFLLADAPFDMAKHFESPPPEQNAAPLYLDALFEFSSDVSVCFTEAEQRLRLPVAKRRLERAYSIHTRRDQNESSVSAQELDAALKELAVGFEKLDAAQRRPQCVFETGLGIGALLPHPQAAREVARWTDIKTQRDLERGQWDEAHRNIERLLRLSRDLRRRGPAVSLLVSVAIDGHACEGPIARMLAAPGLSVQHCDRLLAALIQHQQQAIDPAAEALRNEYVMMRTVLHEIQHRTGDFDPTFMKEELGTDSIGDVMGLHPTGRVLSSARADAIVAKMTSNDYAREHAKANHLYRSLVALRDCPYRELAGRLKAAESEVHLEETPLIYVLAGAIYTTLQGFVRSEAQMHGTQCLVMLRRWQLDRPGESPADLQSVVKAAGMTEVPRDPYADGPLRMAQLQNETVIYSIGSDGQDHKAIVDWNYGQQPGDFIFRIERTP